VSGPANTLEDDCYNSNNVTFSGTAMDLNVTNQPSSCNGKSYPYTGAMVSSNPDDGRASGGFQYTYGVLEAKVYIPADGSQIANWPAVWTTSQNWPMTGEDDLFEGLDGQGCYHWHYGSSASDPQQEGGCDTALTPGWHTFASDWQPGEVTYYYDGKEVGRFTSNVTSAPQSIILDNTIAAAELSISEADTMQVSYVRVWQAA
jgi:beta-glucanase (GH16 family)